MSAPTRDLVTQVAADILGLRAADLGDDAGVDVTVGWDSLQHLSILMALEEELGIRLDPDVLVTHKTVGALVGLIDPLRSA